MRKHRRMMTEKQLFYSLVFLSTFKMFRFLLFKRFVSFRKNKWMGLQMISETLQGRPFFLYLGCLDIPNLQLILYLLTVRVANIFFSIH